MELQINYLNKEIEESNGMDGNIETATWHNRWKIYKSDSMDDDMKNSTISHYVDRVIINDAQFTNKKSIDDMIEFLNTAKESFKY